jgi:hypothetical protein
MEERRGEKEAKERIRIAFSKRPEKTKELHCFANVGCGLVVSVIAGASGKKASKAEGVFLKSTI